MLGFDWYDWYICATIKSLFLQNGHLQKEWISILQHNPLSPPPSHIPHLSLVFFFGSRNSHSRRSQVNLYIAPENRPGTKRKFIFQPSIFRGYLYTPRKTNMAMENGIFEDVFLWTKLGLFRWLCKVYRGVYKFVLCMHTDWYLIIFISIYKCMHVSLECSDPSFRKVKLLWEGFEDLQVSMSPPPKKWGAELQLHSVVATQICFSCSSWRLGEDLKIWRLHLFQMGWWKTTKQLRYEVQVLAASWSDDASFGDCWDDRAMLRKQRAVWYQGR